MKRAAKHARQVRSTIIQNTKQGLEERFRCHERILHIWPQVLQKHPGYGAAAELWQEGHGPNSETHTGKNTQLIDLADKQVKHQIPQQFQASKILLWGRYACFTTLGCLQGRQVHCRPAFTFHTAKLYSSIQFK